MDLKIAVLVYLIALTAAIEVYEEIDEPVYTRIARNPKHAQQDMQKLRYYQQQQFDMNNRHRIFKREAQITQVPQLTYYIPEKAPSVNFGLNHANNLKLLQESFGGLTTHNDLTRPHEDENLSALTALIGKPSNIQLQGFEQLLSGVKDHTPITENVPDVANPQERPNIKVEHESTNNRNLYLQGELEHNNVIDLSIIEKQLNDAAHLQAQKALQQARSESEAHVKAQHEAIAHAQIQAQNAALAKLHYNPIQVEALAPVHNEVGVYSDGTEKNSLQYASQYAFGYRVHDYHSGNHFGHEEKHDGKTAKGNYHVLLPDGRLQVVDYWADKTGYHAKVTYDKVAKH